MKRSTRNPRATATRAAPARKGTVGSAKAARRAGSGILAAVHESAAGLLAEGLISKTTMREYDALCLTPVEEIGADEIVALRKSVAVSQPVFAAYLNVAKSTVSQWERGEKKPDGTARKLLDLVRRKGLEVLA